MADPSLRGVEFYGGPHDGTKLTRKTDPAGRYVFTDGERCFKAPRDGRVLYRRKGFRRGWIIYEYEGNRVALCTSCGSFTTFGHSPGRGKWHCELCGGTLAQGR